MAFTEVVVDSQSRGFSRQDLKILATGHSNAVAILLTDDPAVVSQVPVQDGQPNVQEDAMGALVQQQDAEHLQTVSVDIELVEMIQARVATYLEFLIV